MSVSSFDQAVVLAAGEGSRIRPLTRYQPKPMLRVAGRPILEYPLDALDAFGVEEVAMVVGHAKTRIQNHFGDDYRGLDLTYLTQQSQLGSGHALQVAADHVSDEFLVVNGDNVIDEAMVRGTAERYAESGAVVRNGTCLHASTTVGENAVLEGSIVGPDARIGAGAVLRDTIVGGGATIGDGTVSPGRSATLVLDGVEYTDRRLGGIVADRATVGSNVTVTPGCRVGPRATVGSGVALRHDVPEGAEVMG